MDVVGWARVLS